MSDMLVITPLGHVVQLTACGDGRFAEVKRPIELNTNQAGYYQIYRENDWLREEGFVELVVGRMALDPNPELEELWNTIKGLV